MKPDTTAKRIQSANTEDFSRIISEGRSRGLAARAAVAELDAAQTDGVAGGLPPTVTNGGSPPWLPIGLILRRPELF